MKRCPTCNRSYADNALVLFTGSCTSESRLPEKEMTLDGAIRNLAWRGAPVLNRMSLP